MNLLFAHKLSYLGGDIISLSAFDLLAVVCVVAHAVYAVFSDGDIQLDGFFCKMRNAHRLALLGKIILIALRKSALSSVIYTAEVSCHYIVKYDIDKVYHLFARAVIVIESMRTAKRGVALKGSVFCQKYLRICQTELINTLLDVAYHKQVFAVGKPRQYIFLNGVDILIFVDADIVVTIRRIFGYPVVLQSLDCIILQVGKIHLVVSYLCAGILFCHPAQHVDKSLYIPSASEYIFLHHVVRLGKHLIF